MSSAFVLFSVWLAIISGASGCLLGMALVLRYSKHTPKADPEPIAPPVCANSDTTYLDEIRAVLATLVQINSQVDSRVGQHIVEVEGISQSLENRDSAESKPLIQAAKLLIAANRHLQSDLTTARNELKNQRELVDSFKQESRTDALTELLNRRGFDGELKDSLRRLEEQDTTFSLLFVDIDHFKQINDAHGHLNGDQILAALSQCLKSNIHVPASIARYGGEEFAVILPSINAKRAFQIAEQVRHSIEVHPFLVEGAATKVTVSIGVTEAVQGDERAELIERADRGVYAAKHGGRNRTMLELKEGAILELTSSASPRSLRDILPSRVVT